MALADIWHKLENTLQDLTTLDVVTLTGTIDWRTAAAELPAVPPGAQPPTAPTVTALSTLPAIIEKKLKEAMTGAEIRASLVAFTHIEIDLDSTHFVQANADPALLEAHKEIVRAAQEARSAFVKLVAGVVRG